MDTIKILWLAPDRKERASFELVAGDLEAASGIFTDMINCLNREKEGSDLKKLALGLPDIERNGES